MQLFDESLGKPVIALCDIEQLERIEQDIREQRARDDDQQAAAIAKKRADKKRLSDMILRSELFKTNPPFFYYYTTSRRFGNLVTLYYFRNPLQRRSIRYHTLGKAYRNKTIGIHIHRDVHRGSSVFICVLWDATTIPQKNVN